MNGNPHSRVNTVPDDWVTKCDQKPSWVPGRLKLCRNWVSALPQSLGRC